MEYSILLPQIHSLHSQVPKGRTLAVLIRTLFGTSFPKEKPAKVLTYIYLTRLLWEYIAETLPPELLAMKEAPEESAKLVKWKKRSVSQELAKAILDYHTITSQIQVKGHQKVVIFGAGQWHLGYVFLNQCPALKYVIVDTQAALQNAYDKFSKVFPEKNLWIYPAGESFEKVKESFDKASVCFIQPSSLSTLPAGSMDLGIMIDFLDQLDQNELNHHFAIISRLVNGHVYFKQHKKGRLREADYLVPDDWEEVFWRTCPLYPLSFEALFQKVDTF